MSRTPWDEDRAKAPARPPPPGKGPARDGEQRDRGLDAAFEASTTLREQADRAHAGWKKALKIGTVLMVLLALATWFNRWSIRSSIEGSVKHDVIMGFDAHLLESTRTHAAAEGFTLGPDGVQGWLVGEDRNWIISVQVQMRGALVFPYFTHLVFEDTIPHSFDAESRAAAFVDAGWYFDEAMVERAERPLKARHEYGSRQIVQQMREQIVEPPQR